MVLRDFCTYVNVHDIDSADRSVQGTEITVDG